MEGINLCFIESFIVELGIVLHACSTQETGQLSY